MAAESHEAFTSSLVAARVRSTVIQTPLIAIESRANHSSNVRQNFLRITIVAVSYISPEGEAKGIEIGRINNWLSQWAFYEIPSRSSDSLHRFPLIILVNDKLLISPEQYH